MLSRRQREQGASMGEDGSAKHFPGVTERRPAPRNPKGRPTLPNELACPLFASPQRVSPN